MKCGFSLAPMLLAAGLGALALAPAASSCDGVSVRIGGRSACASGYCAPPAQVFEEQFVVRQRARIVFDAPEVFSFRSSYCAPQRFSAFESFDARSVCGSGFSRSGFSSRSVESFEGGRRGLFSRRSGRSGGGDRGANVQLFGRGSVRVRVR